MNNPPLARNTVQPWRPRCRPAPHGRATPLRLINVAAQRLLTDAIHQNAIRRIAELIEDQPAAAPVCGFLTIVVLIAEHGTGAKSPSVRPLSRT